jgi:hypothetical protein
MMNELVFDILRTATSKKKKEILNQMNDYSNTFPDHLVRVRKPDVPGTFSSKISESWRSRKFVAVVYAINENIERISINRTDFNQNHTRWKDGISWDDIQRLKAECGRGHLEAVEVYPADKDIVNLANIRHIWVFKSGSLHDQGIGWKKS